MKQLILRPVVEKSSPIEDRQKRTFRNFFSGFSFEKPRAETNQNFVLYKEILCKKFVKRIVGRVDGFYICERCDRFYQKNEKILVATLFDGCMVPICKNEIALGFKCNRLLNFFPLPPFARQARSLEINYDRAERRAKVAEVQDLFPEDQRNFSIVCFRCNLLYEGGDEIKVEMNVLQRQGSTITCTEKMLPFTECESPLVRVAPEIMAKYYEAIPRKKAKV